MPCCLPATWHQTAREIRPYVPQAAIQSRKAAHPSLRSEVMGRDVLAGRPLVCRVTAGDGLCVPSRNRTYHGV